MIETGAIYWADLDQAGRRPVVVVSREELNRGNYALAVICTTARFAVRRTLPNCIPFQAGDFGLPSDCVAQCEYLHSLDQSWLDLATGPIGKLDDLTLRDVIKAIGYVLDSDCEPN